MVDARPKPSFLRTAKAVAWSFVGLRKSSGLDADQRLNPLHVVAVGFAAVILLVLALIALVHWVA